MTNVLIEKDPTGEWKVHSDWGMTSWPTWGNACHFIRQLTGTINTALARRAAYLATTTGTCNHGSCGEPGVHLPQGRGFCFCPTHTPAAVQVLAFPPRRDGREHWPALIPLETKEPSAA